MSKDEGKHGNFHKLGRAVGRRTVDLGNNLDGIRKSASSILEESSIRIKDNLSFDAALVNKVDRRKKRSVWSVVNHGFSDAHFATFPSDLIRPCIMAGCPEDGIVLDPFGGAGTTGLVAMQQGRQSILFELNPKYAEIAERRLRQAWLDGGRQLDLLRQKHHG